MKHDYKNRLKMSCRFDGLSTIKRRATDLSADKEFREALSECVGTSITARSKKKRLDALVLVLANAYFASCHQLNSDKWIVYRRKDDTGLNKWIQSTVDALAMLGFLEHNLGKNMVNGVLRRTGVASSYRLTRKLKNYIGNIACPVFIFPKEEKLVELRVTKTKEQDSQAYQVVKATVHKIEKDIRHLNDWRSNLVFTYDGVRFKGLPTKRIYSTPDREDENTIYLYETFQYDSFMDFGRFINPVQNFKNNHDGRELRLEMLIEGEPVAELDFVAMHARILFEMEDQAAPADPYNIKGYDRSVVKYLFNMLLNTKGTIGARKAAQKAISDDVAPIQVASLPNTAISDYLKKIVDTHPYLKEAFDSRGTGLWLMGHESGLAELILKDCLKQDIKVIDIHDGFLCKFSDKEKLEAVITNAWYSYFREFKNEVVNKPILKIKTNH